MEFQYPHMFFAMTALPVLLLVWWLLARRRRRVLARFGDQDLLKQLMPDESATRRHLKLMLLLLACFFILLGMTNPRFGKKLEKVKKKGSDIVICLDISNSMRARDIRPDRLERAKMAIEKLIDRFENDQLGIVVFAGRAVTQLPLTPDYAGAKLYLQNISTDIIGIQGTAIGAALELAGESFNYKSKTKKFVILISDGENHEDDAMAAARNVAQKGVIIFTVGMGSPEGAPVPVQGEKGMEYKKAADGSTVVSRLNEEMLKQIAATGRGTYTRAGTADAGLDKIYREIGKQEKAEYEALSYAEYENLYPWLIGLGLLLLLAEFLIFERKTALTRNIQMFSKPASEYVLRKNHS